MEIFNPILEWQLMQVAVKIDQYRFGLIEKHLKPKVAKRRTMQYFKQKALDNR